MQLGKKVNGEDIVVAYFFLCVDDVSQSIVHQPIQISHFSDECKSRLNVCPSSTLKFSRHHDLETPSTMNEIDETINRKSLYDINMRNSRISLLLSFLLQCCLTSAFYISNPAGKRILSPALVATTANDQRRNDKALTPPRRRSKVNIQEWKASSNDDEDVIRSSVQSPLSCYVGLLASALSWCAISWRGLMFHPNPKVAAGLCLRHNLFTVAHAWIFPISITTASFMALRHESADSGPLLLGICLMSLWTSAAVVFGPTFSVGYHLFSNPFKYVTGSIHLTVAFWAMIQYRSTVKDGNPIHVVRRSVKSLFSLLDPQNEQSALYAASSLGLFALAVLPQLVAFPSATIPTLLGKRLSRSASGFTFLGQVVAGLLKQGAEENRKQRILQWGLGIGSIAHLVLVVSKLIGVDGGGLLIQGRGLWELYPSLVNASGAATVLMLVTYSVTAIACTTTGTSTEKGST